MSPARVFAAQDVTATHLFLSVLVCSFFASSWEEDGTKSVVLVVLEEEVWQRCVAVVQTFVRGWTLSTKERRRMRVSSHESCYVLIFGDIINFRN